MRISDWSSDVCSSDLALPFDLAEIRRISIVACGTSYYAGMVAKYWIEQLARVPVELDIASEFRYRAPVLEEGGMALFISQSGETADTLAALRHAAENGQKTAVVVNVASSAMARERSEEHQSELRSLMRISDAGLGLNKTRR